MTSFLMFHYIVLPGLTSHFDKDILISAISFKERKKNTYFEHSGSINIYLSIPCDLWVCKCLKFSLTSELVRSSFLQKKKKNQCRDFPSTFRGAHGEILYTLTVGINRPWHMSKDFVTELNYVHRIDTNQPELHVSDPRPC